MQLILLKKRGQRVSDLNSYFCNGSNYVEGGQSAVLTVQILSSRLFNFSLDLDIALSAVFVYKAEVKRTSSIKLNAAAVQSN